MIKKGEIVNITYPETGEKATAEVIDSAKYDKFLSYTVFIMTGSKRGQTIVLGEHYLRPLTGKGVTGVGKPYKPSPWR